ncbi:hypothetical protein J4N42_16960 [Vibrio sp. SCSIO 43135]|uniref:porin family protein n=1 Tax=Vibrio sp. SCSIO 43135 TaxID=2819096 RepID=UPI00207531E5|nr:porin family protein [Vibrio sp. SCSIO 43135]USD43847.1 hypothetical protein J4N42_16960 [Vibrio sp. SCSIO 43135]
MKLKYAVLGLAVVSGCVSSMALAGGVEPFFGVEASYNLTNPGIERVGSGTISGVEDTEFDKEISPGFYTGVVLSQHHRLKLGYMDKDFAGISVARYYTAYDYIFGLSDRFNLTAGLMVGYDDSGVEDEYSSIVAGGQVGAEYRMRDFSVELGYQVSANYWESEDRYVSNPDFNGSGLAGVSGSDQFADDNMLYLRLNYYFGGAR